MPKDKKKRLKLIFFFNSNKVLFVTLLLTKIEVREKLENCDS